MKKGKILSFIISSVMMLSVTAASASAADTEPSYSAVMTFGDSIAACSVNHQSFASLAGEYIMPSDGADASLYYAENGKTSAEILDSIKNNEALINPKEIYGGEYDGNYNELYVFISAGGNDYLDYFEEILTPYYAEEGDSLLTLTPEKIETVKANILADQENFMMRINAASDITAEAIENSSEMVSYIKEIQPDAEIYFLEIYNVFAGFAETGDATMTMISTLASNILKGFNSRLAEIDGIHVVKTFDAIGEHPSDYIIENDIHPTLAGHVRIAQLILSEITKEDDTTILRNMKNGQNGFAPLLSLIDYNSLPEYMKDGVETETPEETTAVTEVTQITASESSTSAATTASSTAASTSASVSAVSSSPATSDRGLSSVVVSGFFAAAAACVAFRKKENR